MFQVWSAKRELRKNIKFHSINTVLGDKHCFFFLFWALHCNQSLNQSIKKHIFLDNNVYTLFYKNYITHQFNGINIHSVKLKLTVFYDYYYELYWMWTLTASAIHLGTFWLFDGFAHHFQFEFFGNLTDWNLIAW